MAVGLTLFCGSAPGQKRGTGRFSRPRAKIKIIKNLKKIDGVVDVWSWRKYEDRLMTIELEGDGMMG